MTSFTKLEEARLAEGTKRHAGWPRGKSATAHQIATARYDFFC